MEAEQARAGRRMGAFGGRHRPDRARLHQVGRPAGLAAAFRRVRGARLQDRDDAADGAGAARRSTASCRKIPIPDRGELRIPKLATVIPPQGDAGALAEAAKMLVAAENPVIICRPPGAHARRHERVWSNSPRRCNAPVDRQCRPHELPVAPSAQPELPPRRHRPGRRHSRDRDERLLGRAERLQRPHRAHVALAREAGRQDHHARRARPLPQGQLPGFRALRRMSTSPSRATARPPCRR